MRALPVIVSVSIALGATSAAALASDVTARDEATSAASHDRTQASAQTRQER